MTDPISVGEWKLKALTDIWTGDADRKGDRLITTGLLGSIRFWFEVLVRGLGGSACDPSDHANRCPQGSQKESTDDGHHCVVCELFGCTGWARKFRFQVLDENGNVKQDQIKKGQVVRLVFIELRPIRPEEWALLDLTLRLIADYGAIGGHTVFKPTDELNRQNEFHHKDFGLIQVESAIPRVHACTGNELRQYVNHVRWRRVNHDGFAWASLDNFWCVKGRYLARKGPNVSSYNYVIGRPEPKSQSSQGDSWIAGRRPNQAQGILPESKKVFSFKDPKEARRTFGFVESEEGFAQVREKLEGLKSGAGNRKLDPGWRDFSFENEFRTKECILSELLREEAGT